MKRTATQSSILLVPANNSFHDIAVNLEAWVLFALIIITNCEKPLESSLKTFVFFLISQPLVYLLQVPFSTLGWGIFGYYKYWFMITLLTLPGAFIGWYVKKTHILSGLILSVMLVLLAFQGISYIKEMTGSFPGHLLSCMFCFAQIPLYIIVILKNKYARITATVISFAAIIGFAVFNLAPQSFEMTYVFPVDRDKIPVESSWTVRVEDENISTAELLNEDEGYYYLRMLLKSEKPNTVIFTDPEGKEYRIVVFNDNEYGAQVVYENEVSASDAAS